MIDLAKAVASIDVSGFPIRLELSATERGDIGLELRATLQGVPDRETKQPTNIYFVEMLTMGTQVFKDQARLIDYLWHFARRAVIHELAEHFLVNGVRVFDPHPKT